MVQRTLRVTPELMIDFLRAFEAGPPRRFVVEADPIPADAKIISVRYSPYYANTIEIVLQSSAWAEAQANDPVLPYFRVIHDPDPPA